MQDQKWRFAGCGRSHPTQRSPIARWAAVPLSIGRALRTLALPALLGLRGQFIYLVIESIHQLRSRFLGNHAVADRPLNCASMRCRKTRADCPQFLVSLCIAFFMQVCDLGFGAAKDGIQPPPQPSMERR